jgi:hypothetical protein
VVGVIAVLVRTREPLTCSVERVATVCVTPPALAFGITAKLSVPVLPGSTLPSVHVMTPPFSTPSPVMLPGTRSVLAGSVSVTTMP